MTFYEWAIKWRVPIEAVRDYQLRLGTYDEQLTDTPPDGSEAAVIARCKVQASKMGGRLWRNNKGAAYLQDGTFLRYGLLNESGRISDGIKSSDLIGIYPKLITQAMVGSTLGQFWMVEGKKPNWTYSGDEHEVAQLKFLELGLALGCRASFATSEKDI